MEHAKVFRTLGIRFSESRETASHVMMHKREVFACNLASAHSLDLVHRQAFGRVLRCSHIVYHWRSWLACAFNGPSPRLASTLAAHLACSLMIAGP